MSAKRETSIKAHYYAEAILFIHDIQEPRPMEILHKFADAVLPEPEKGGSKFWAGYIAPYEFSNLRMVRARYGPRINIFEYYWQNKVEGTNISHIGSWLILLLLRSPMNVPLRLLPLWCLSWVLVITAIATVSTGIFNSIQQRVLQFLPFVGTLLITTLLALVQKYILANVGRSARYLNPSPSNNKLRQEIQVEGVKMLKKLHEVGKFDRIILVGHGVGSVIAYDILRQAWQDYADIYTDPLNSKQEALKNVEHLGENLLQSTKGVSTEDYLGAQVELWKELRSLGHSWLVTDYVTLGSPLSHAVMILANNESDLRARQLRRELPTNPPVPEIEQDDRVTYSYRPWEALGPNKDIRLRALHSAALFAVTRWTNLYFPGDFAGGPLTSLGAGIRNVRVRSGKFLVDRTIRGYRSYWNGDPKLDNSKENPLYELRSTLDLANRKYLEMPNVPEA